MNEETEQPDDDEPEVEAQVDPQTELRAEPQGPLGGERLAEARRAQQISVLEIAKELHLDEPKVRALERNEFDVLGAPVFAKGHLRKYARLVGVDNDDVLADYYRLTRSQTMPPVVTHRRLPKRSISPGPWIAVIVVLLIVAMAYVLLVMQPFATPDSDSPVDTPVATVAPDSGAGSGDATDDEQDSAVEEQVVEEPVVEEQVVEEQVAGEQVVGEQASGVAVQPGSPAQQDLTVADVEPVPPAAAAAAGDVRLTVTFAGDCWTEITDASGRRLFFDLGRSGRTINVSGQAPLSVLFGDADNVTLRVDGADFAIADADRRGRTARFMLHGT